MDRSLIEKMKRFEVTETGCWEWQGHVKDNGYGYVSHKGKKLRAHRVALEAKIGTIPDGKLACHTCDNRKCVNPDHLYAGTPSDNINDAYSRGRHPGCGRGSRHHSSKLTEKKVKEIRGSSLKQKDLAERFGVSQTTISEVRSGKIWRHVA